MDEITIGDKIYVSTKRAAKITGYAKDYVGQLCREGRVEARLVGRNWYVLETSIREHRFGEPEEARAEVKTPEIKPVDSASTWQKPQYVSETPVFVPDLAPKEHSTTAGSPAIADMQSAWREWFEEKKQNSAEIASVSPEEQHTEPAPIENPHNLLADHIEEEESVPLNRLQEAAETPLDEYVREQTADIEEVVEEETEIPVHRSYARHEAEDVISMNDIPVVNLTLSRHTAAKPARIEERSASGVLRAVFVVVAVAAVILAIIGTGNAERLISGTSLNLGPQKAILDFLGGTSTYKNSL